MHTCEAESHQIFVSETRGDEHSVSGSGRNEPWVRSDVVLDLGVYEG
jgi:hypothetical protein